MNKPFWNAYSSSYEGIYHKKSKVGIQDFSCYRIDENKNFSIVVLADGAGSYKNSYIGAKRTSEWIAMLLYHFFNKICERNDSGTYITSTLEKYLYPKLSKEYNLDVKEFSSTLLFVAIKGDDTIIGHIGDGIIGAYDGKFIHTISYPKNLEYANETVFTTSYYNKNRLRIQKLKKDKFFKGFLLLTDGLTSVLYDKKIKRFSEWLNDTFNVLINEKYKIEDMKEALNESMEVLMNKIPNGDDGSIGLLWKKDLILTK
jgi:serine/threonine protein phosphatase PrpC